MEFLKLVRRRSFLSELIYIVLNIGLAIGILVLVRTIESPLPAFGLVVLGKWRILAVRPRYWFANIQANIVDIIVSVSVVVLLYTAAGMLPVQIAITLLYIGWLLFVRPRSKRVWIAVQAGVAIFLGTAALAMVSPSWPASAVVLLGWLIGYGAARHVLTSYEEPHTLFYSLLWGFVMAELTWLTYHWMFAYPIPGLGKILLPQVSFISLGLSFVALRAYGSYHKHGVVKMGDILLPILLTISVILLFIMKYNCLKNGQPVLCPGLGL